MTESGFVSLLSFVDSERLPMLFEAMPEGRPAPLGILHRQHWQPPHSLRLPQSCRELRRLVYRKRRHRHHHLSQNGGKLEFAQHMAGHDSARTTGLYNRRSDEVALDEVERIAYWP